MKKLLYKYPCPWGYKQKERKGEKREGERNRDKIKREKEEERENQLFVGDMSLVSKKLVQYPLHPYHIHFLYSQYV